MSAASELFDRQYAEMRWRILSLAADFDRLERAEGGDVLLTTDERIRSLRACIETLLDETSDQKVSHQKPSHQQPSHGGALEEGAFSRAERVQLILSDKSPPPPKNNTLAAGDKVITAGPENVRAEIMHS